MTAVFLIDPARQVSAYDLRLAAALARCGMDVTWVTSPPVHDRVAGLDGVRELRSFGRLIADGASYDRLDRDPYGAVDRWRRRVARAIGYPVELLALGRRMRRCARDAPTVAHVQWALAPPMERLAWRGWRRAGIPIVMTVHNVLPHERRPADARRWRVLYRGADRLIVHSYATAERLRRSIGRDGPPISVVPMPAFGSEDAIARGRARRTLSLAPEDRVALLFGLVRAYKGWEVLLAAWPRVAATLPGARLIMAGPVPGGARGRMAVADAIARSGAAATIDWRPGYQPPEAVDMLMAASDVVALPYRDTDDSAVAALARGYGRAVVASDVGGLSEAVGDGGTLVTPGDAGALAVALTAALADDRRRAGWEAAQRKAAAAWSWDDAAAATREVYREVLDGGMDHWRAAPDGRIRRGTAAGSGERTAVEREFGAVPPERVRDA